MVRDDLQFAPKRLLVVLPTWVGDCVMATPTLRALRQALPEAHITGLCRRNVKGVLSGLPYLDRLVSRRGNHSLRAVARRLRSARFDAVILLPNSFESAALVRLAGIPRRIGYARDGRGWLLTDRLRPPMTGRIPNRRFAVTPTLDYYLAIVRYLGLATAGNAMELAVTPADRLRAEQVLVSAGLEEDLCCPAEKGRPPLVMLNPGARYGAAKLWPPAHYAALADRLADEWGATVLASVAPNERQIVAEIQEHAACDVIDLAAHGLTLGAVKELCRRADLVVTNDTGTRHIAAAIGTRLVTIFGPTDRKWTTINHALERELWIDVPCGPCQLKTCPLPEPATHQCMRELTPAMVFDAAVDLMSRPREGVKLPVAPGGSKVSM